MSAGSGTWFTPPIVNGHKLGAVDITGRNPGWEMHPDTDELFYIIDGEAEITLLDEDGPDHHVAPTGTAFVVPKGVWHKPEAPKGARILFFTPGESVTSHADDPRQE
ncbi:MAG: cupin domain-containing protein [Proteobacteria bacterium]|nr:cupin domain-containing protein [Pseudomonadota bacterium]